MPDDFTDTENEAPYWGRPELPPGEHLDRSVTVQVRHDTWKAWRAAADDDGVSLAAWVRGRVGVSAEHVAKGDPSPVTPAPSTNRIRGAVDPELARQVAALGNNVNQTARQINAVALAGYVNDSIAGAALDVLVDLREDLDILATVAMRGVIAADADAGDADEATD